MNTKTIRLLVSILLATTLTSFSQPLISSISLSGQPQTASDGSHPYARFSASPGADVTLTATVTTSTPFHYQWQFNQNDLLDQTNKSLRISSLALSNAGSYTFVATNNQGLTNKTITLDVDPTFTKITAGSLVTDLGFSGGGTWADYNNDGFLDLFVPNGMDGGVYVPFLYRNNTNGTFNRVISGAPNLAVESYSACWGDYDNDGNPDLFVTTTSKNLLYHNDGNGTFTRITTGSVVSSNLYSLGAAWGDFDNDGFLDLLVTTLDTSGSGNAHNYLYRNNGDGTFTSITNSSLVAERLSSADCAWGDYDNDGHPDLFVGAANANGVLQPNRLYHNNGDGTFTKITSGSIATDLGGPPAKGAWGDYDNDGFLDLFVANGHGLANALYLNNGDGTFTRITSGIVVTEAVHNAHGCAWGDYDNDGFLDLFVSDEGVPGTTPTVVNFLYHNNGNGTFMKITNGSPVSEYSDSWGVSWADYDNDGFLDLFAARGDGRGNFLYHNNGNSNAWLKVKLVGTASNRSAIGAKVRAKAIIGGLIRWQLREITGGGLSGLHNELWANLGLGDATNVDTLRIEWPSGTVQEFHDVAAKQILTITEPPRLLARTTNGVPQFSLKGGRGFQYEIDSSPDLSAWSSMGVLTITNLNGTASIFDTNPPALDQRFYRAVSR